MLERAVRRLLPPEHALNLAVFRVMVAVVVLLTPAVREAVQWVSLPAAMRVPPPGMWSLLPLPVTPMIARVMQLCLVGACFSIIVGWHTRTALIIATLSALYVLGLPQLSGNIVHHHHEVWFLAVLAASPCADVLALDAEGKPTHAASRRHALALLAARWLVAAIFFFPGFWKLRSAGLEWILSDNLRNQMWWKWFQFGGFRPWLRIDRLPWLCRLLAGSAVFFELAFPLLVLFRRTRWIALAGALVFHAFTSLFMRIEFPSLWLCYVVFLDVHGLVQRLRRRGWLPQRWQHALGLGDEAPDEALPKPQQAIVPGLVLGGVVVAGLSGAIRAWPFACYPTFQWMPGTEMPGLSITAVYANGTSAVIDDGSPLGGRRTQAQWGMAWSLAGVMGDPDVEGRLRAHWQRYADDPRSRGAVVVRFDRVSWSVIPEDYGKPPLRSERIAAIVP